MSLSGYTPDNNRSQLMVTANNRVICDSYNANPSSMENAIRSFVNYPGEPKTIILGDMLELGIYEAEEHLKIVNQLQSAGCREIILVGKAFRQAAGNSDFTIFDSVEDLYKYLSERPIKNNFVLVKGSRGISLEKVYPLL